MTTFCGTLQLVHHMYMYKEIARRNYTCWSHVVKNQKCKNHVSVKLIKNLELVHCCHNDGVSKENLYFDGQVNKLSFSPHGVP